MAARTSTRSRKTTTQRSGTRTANRRTTKKSARGATSSKGRSRSTAKRATKRSPRATTRRTTRARKTATRSASSTRKSAASRGQKDIVALLMHDHREVEQMFAKYERLGERATKSKESVVRDVIEELSKHAAVEEQILYPEMKKGMPRGDEMADEGIEEHAEVKRTLADLDKMSPEDEGFDEKMQSLMGSVRHHVKEEENEMFPKFRTAVGQERLVQLGRMVEAAKKIAPTRPHPHAPTTPPGNIVVGAVAGIADRVRDAVRR